MNPQPEVHSLKYHRRWELLSQRDLARLAGITASTIYLIETGKTNASMPVMRKLCKVLGVSWEEVAEFKQALARDGIEVVKW